jgi:hypothetical protein
MDRRCAALVCCSERDVPRAIDTFRRTGAVAPATPPSALAWRPTRCAECGRGMKVLTHEKYGIVTPMSPELYRMIREGQVKGTFCCSECGRCYCYECSHVDKRCECAKGGGGWREGLYMEEVGKR